MLIFLSFQGGDFSKGNGMVLRSPTFRFMISDPDPAFGCMVMDRIVRKIIYFCLQALVEKVYMEENLLVRIFSLSGRRIMHLQSL